MCLICVEMDKQRLSFQEAWRNFREMKTNLEDKHKKEVRQKIIDKMVEERSKRKKDENNPRP